MHEQTGSSRFGFVASSNPSIRCGALLLALLMAGVACRRTAESVEPVAMATVGVEAFGDVLLLSAQLTPTEGLRRPDGWNGTTMPESAVPVRVRQEADALYCRRLADGAPIRYLTFEREGEHSAYGVYGLMGEKNDLPVDYPLRGHPIAWPDLDHEGAMLRQLGMHGVEAAAARELVATRGADWFGEGLRVFFFLDSRAAASFAPVAEARPPRAVLIRVELYSD